MFRPWTIMLVTYWIVMHGPPAMCTFAPRPSMVLNEFMISSSFSLITMSCLKMIHSGSSWITACLRVPGLGFTGLSPESVTTYILPSLPPMACLPNPIAQSARRFRFFSQFGSHLQQSSIGFPLPQDRYPKFLLEALTFLHKKRRPVKWVTYSFNDT